MVPERFTIAIPDERLEEIRQSIEQQLARLEAVRGFDLDESVAPATVFRAKHAPESTHANLRRTSA